MRFSYLLIAFFFLILNGCSDFSSDSNEFELSGKFYACDGDRYGEIIDDSKLGKKQYCNGYRWIDLVPEDSIVTIRPESKDSTVGDLSESKDSSQIMYECNNGSIVINKNLCSKNPKEYLPLDDSEYPYAGIPRIVIETENFRAIKDRETEIPAKFQIWGENAPESEIMELTIKGRGNTTWTYVKKPYAIKFNEKTSLFGMPKAKKWVLLANYRDRTLIRNALALEIARSTEIGWTPSGRFVEVYLNRKFLGNYYLCEKIELSKNRLGLRNNAYLLEFDKNNKENIFKTKYRNIPATIKDPDLEDLSAEQQEYIQNYVNTLETALYDNESLLNPEDYIDLKSMALYWIIYEVATNTEPKHPKSFYMHKDATTKLTAGPVWDFDWETFSSTISGIKLEKAMWNKALLKKTRYKEVVIEQWNKYKEKFGQMDSFIDSLHTYISKSNERNNKMWPIKINDGIIGDESKSFDEAILMLKQSYRNRIQELDELFNKL
ncbi:CotH protein [Fibrobacter sp. UWH9]|nr:CotH protein [Fibrobacter sp. UWH9]